MSVKKKIPMLFTLSTFAFWIVSILLVYIPISPWSGPAFPKSVDASMMNVFLFASALSFAASLMMGLREIFHKPNLKASGKNFLKTRTIVTPKANISVQQPQQKQRS